MSENTSSLIRQSVAVQASEPETSNQQRLSLLLPRRRLIRFPQNFRNAMNVIRPPAPYEKGVAQAIQIWNDLRRNLFLARQAHCDSLRPAANGAARVQFR